MVITSRQPAPIERYFEAPDIHEASRERAAGALPALLAAIILTVAHGLNLYLFVAGESAPLVGLLIHLALVFVTAVVARAMVVKGLDSRFPMVLLVFTALLSAYGAAGTVFSILLYFWYRRSALSFADWYRTIFPSRFASPSEEMYEAISMGRDEGYKSYTVIPFMDVMEVGDDVQKREALSKMAMRFDPAFTPAFRRALQDGSNSVRVQAATAITRIENQFLERLMKLTEIYRKHPSDPVVVKALAEHCDAYAFTGILDGEREQTNRERALHYYLEYLRLKPEDEQARTHVGRLLLRSGDAARAADWLRDSVKAGYHGSALIAWYIEALYEAQRFAELREAAAEKTGFAEVFRSTHPELAESLELWAEAATPQEAL